MLVLSRRPGEEIVINENIRVTVVSVKGDRVRIGILAPEKIPVDRAEVHERRLSFVDLDLAKVHTAQDTGIHTVKTMIMPRVEEAGI